MSKSSSQAALQMSPTRFAEPEVISDAREEAVYLAGEVVSDRYRLVRKLGQGGMGVVWVAHSLVLGVDVALKLIRASRAGAGVGTRMAREAHAAARLAHPALVRVFDFGWTNRGDPFLVMELAQGETLSTLLEREGRVGAIRAVQMLLPIADGLRCAHDKGIVHRDIKPDNVFIAADAFGRLQPKLLDFGIAMVEQPNESKLTQVGAVLGSPEYMSPEQARGDADIDAQSDVWSMCIVLYEMITHSVPFVHENYNALMQCILHDAPLPATELGAGDKALWRILERGLTKSKEGRFRTMTELGEALAHWLYGHGIKEDVCGNSIRAVWLDGSIATARPDAAAITVESEPPPGSSRASTSPELFPDSAFPFGGIRYRLVQATHFLRSWRSLAALAVGGAVLGIAITLLVTSVGRTRESEAQALPGGLNPQRSTWSSSLESTMASTHNAEGYSQPETRLSLEAAAGRSAGASSGQDPKKAKSPTSPRPNARRAGANSRAQRSGNQAHQAIHDFGF